MALVLVPILMACSRSTDIASCANDDYVKSIPNTGSSPQWMSLSRAATVAAREKKFESALALMNQSLENASNAGASPDVLWCLRCKLCEILLCAGKADETLATSDSFLRELIIMDWRQVLMKLRLLDVKRMCLVQMGRINEACVTAEEMNRLDCEVLDAHSPERIRRLMRIFELDFALGQFKKIDAEAQSIESDIKRLAFDLDTNTYQILAIVGVAQVLSGNEKGRDKLAMAAKIESEIGKQFLPGWIEENVKKMDKRDEIYKLLDRPMSH